MSRINLDDTLIDIIVKMADGNPGAASVMGELMRDGHLIDPDNMFGGMSCIMRLDSLGIYGPNIWILYKDVCGESIFNLVALLRGFQLGFTNELVIRDHLNVLKSNGIPFAGLDELILKVQEELPNFSRGK